MNIEFGLEIILLALIIIQFIVMIVLLSKNRQGSQVDVTRRLTEYTQRLEKNESTLRDEFGRNREELRRRGRAHGR